MDRVKQMDAGDDLPTPNPIHFHLYFGAEVALGVGMEQRDTLFLKVCGQHETYFPKTTQTMSKDKTKKAKDTMGNKAKRNSTRVHVEITFSITTVVLLPYKFYRVTFIPSFNFGINFGKVKFSLCYSSRSC